MVQNKHGFTLIEILISLTIILLFTGMSLAYYNRQENYKKLIADADGLIDVLELAKKKSISGDIDSQASCDFKGYSLSFYGNTYSLNLLCSSTILIHTYTLSRTVTFSPLPTTITFLPLTGSNNSTQTATLYESASAKSIVITVNNGNISRP